MSDERPDDQDQSNEIENQLEPAPMAEPNPPAPEISTQEVDPTPETDNIVDRWFDSYIRGTVAAQSTVVWNHLWEVKEHLKRMLKAN